MDWYLTGRQAKVMDPQAASHRLPSDGVVVHVHLPQTTHHLELVIGRFRRAALILRPNALRKRRSGSGLAWTGVRERESSR